MGIKYVVVTAITSVSLLGGADGCWGVNGEVKSGENVLPSVEKVSLQDSTRVKIPKETPKFTQI